MVTPAGNVPCIRPLLETLYPYQAHYILVTLASKCSHRCPISTMMSSMIYPETWWRVWSHFCAANRSRIKIRLFLVTTLYPVYFCRTSEVCRSSPRFLISLKQIFNKFSCDIHSVGLKSINFILDHLNFDQSINIAIVYGLWVIVFCPVAYWNAVQSDLPIFFCGPSAALIPSCC